MKSVMQPIFEYMKLQRRQFARERAEQSEIAKQNPIDWARVARDMGGSVVPMVRIPIISTDPMTGRKTQE